MARDAIRKRPFAGAGSPTSKGLLLGYVRVSKGDEQANTLQARALQAAGCRRKKLDAAKRREIAESVITGRKSGAEMARLYNISPPTLSRIVAQHRMASR